MTRQLFVDKTTLRELDLFGSRDRGPSVFDVLDCTMTKGGQRALRARFTTPVSDAARIREIQSGVKFLLKQNISFGIDPYLITQVEGYLFSRWKVASSGSAGLRVLESTWLAVRYQDFVGFARAGIVTVRHLVERARRMVEGIQCLEPPTELAEPLSRLSRSLDVIHSVTLPLGRSPWTVLTTDRSLRSTNLDTMQRMLAALYEIDALCAMAETTKRNGLTFPDIIDSSDFLLEGKDLFHPFVKDPIGNPVSLSGGETLVFLTGPNMAGKTTYLKSIALAAYLAHIGMAVPASSFRLAPLQALFTSLFPEDNLRLGLSYFMAEVRRVRETAEGVAENRKALVLVDEVFKGTNVKDALEATRLVILGFSKVATSGFIFSSHLVELATTLQDHQSIRFACLEGQIDDGQPRYEYVLREGISAQRFGLRLLEQEGVPDLLAALAG